MDAMVRLTKRADRGQRSRVVLTPRRWRQARDSACRITRVMVARKPGHLLFDSHILELQGGSVFDAAEGFEA